MEPIAVAICLAALGLASFEMLTKRPTLSTLLGGSVYAVHALDKAPLSSLGAWLRRREIDTEGAPKRDGASILEGPSAHVPYKCIHHAFGRHAIVQPKGMAVIDHDGQSISYEELHQASLSMAVMLRAYGVRRGTCVCLVIQRSIPHIAAILSIVRLGASYIPLDGALIPDNSLEDIVADARPVLILASVQYMDRVAPLGCASQSLEDVFARARAQSEHATSCGDLEGARPDDTAYVIYTSGTTGKPKGVAVSHQSVLNLVALRPGNLGIASGTKVAQLLNVAFDMCAWEIFACILNGGVLYLRGPRRTHWIQVLKTVDVVICTPSILDPHDPADYPNIKVVATAGEPCSQALADRWSQRAAFYNCCGPTEVTIVNTMHLHRVGAPLSIGGPTPNNRVYVLDEDLHPVPKGEVGMMWAGGLGVSKGYLNRPELNSCKFKHDPFFGGIMFNTGDLGRVTDDGSLDHLGRLDEQVKVKGFRVELDGVSAAMRSTPGVISACALLIDAELWGFFSPKHIDASEVKCTVARCLPCYAVPETLVAMDALPLTGNGKVDKRRLRQLAGAA
ncbi:acyl-CoA ligase [Gelatoporia subvermispora B]|uniref:Acyl-CoA ligase n=1 Tax=Ceriporiopsis subvermispora (strain B) TaxID=914234 RepID=M2QF69_CERS8|nr:acyl-CoA ligase [Gelatoporia subvermispora B]